MTVFSISNGYLGNICMMMGPKTVENDSYQVNKKYCQEKVYYKHKLALYDLV